MLIDKKNLILLGMMGSGKTTLGKIVAKKHDLEFIDVDAEIEKKNSMSISEIFIKKGESFFRKEEENEVIKILKKKKCIIALGGGAFMNETIRKNILKNSISVWLEVDLKILNRRISWSKTRPLLNEPNKLKKLKILYDERKNIYKLANYKIVCDKLNKEEIAKKIIELYEKN